MMPPDAADHIRLQQQIRKEIQADARLKAQIDRVNHTRPTITEEPIPRPVSRVLDADELQKHRFDLRRER